MKTNLILFVFIGLLANATLNAQTIWPVNGHVYQVIPTITNWDGAQIACEGMMAEVRGEMVSCHLATISSQAENDFIRDLIDDADLEGNYHWIGGNDRVQEGRWVWVTGEPWNYENWDDDNNEPNNVDGDEDCLTMIGENPDQNGQSFGEWNDSDCDEPVFGFVCECGIDEPAIPTLSQWGLIILLLSLIVFGTVAVRVLGNVRLKPTR